MAFERPSDFQLERWLVLDELRDVRCGIEGKDDKEWFRAYVGSKKRIWSSGTPSAAFMAALEDWRKRKEDSDAR